MKSAGSNINEVERKQIKLTLIVFIIFFLIIILTIYTIRNGPNDFLALGYWYYAWTAVGVLMGIILHELSHSFMCDITGVKIIDIQIFPTGKDNIDILGFVIHEAPNRISQALLITLGPFFFVGVFIILSIMMTEYLEIREMYIFIWWMCLTVGLIFGLFPSRQDIEGAMYYVRSIDNSLIRIIVTSLFFSLSLFSSYIVRGILIAIFIHFFISESGVEFG